MSLGKSLDESLSIGEEVRFKQKHKKLMLRLAKTTHFVYEEIEILAVIYYKLQKISGNKHTPVRQSIIKDVLHKAFDLTDYELTSVIMLYFQKKTSPFIDLDTWIRMLNMFLRGTLEEKITYCFEVYRNAGMVPIITQKTLIHLLRHSLINYNNEDDIEAVKDMVEMLLKRMDFDRDGKLSFEDFQQTVLEKPQLLELFGPVLPSRIATYAFQLSAFQNVRKK